MPSSTETDHTAATSRPVTRRRVLLGSAGLLTGIGVTGTASASSHDAEVYQTGSTWYATNGGTVYAGGSYRDAIQAAVDSLTDGRTTKEKVLIKNSGTFTATESLKSVRLDSYTVIDHNGTIFVEDTGEDLIVPFEAENVQSIEIQNLRVEGNPRYGLWIKSCSDVALGTIEMSLYDTTDIGLGIRVDDSGGGGRTQGFSLEYASIEGAAHHAVETYGVDGVDIGTVETVDTDGCGLLLNDTTDATVDAVDATRADQGGGYAGFRCANDCGPNIYLGELRAVDCGRGLFTVSGSHGITVSNVSIESCESGALIQDTRNMTVDGGTITNNVGEGIRIDSRSSDAHHYTRDVTVQNLQIDNNDYGVYETGPDTEENRILNNSLCNNATGIETYAATTEVSGNTFC
ncbi:right-handed parallel beta-helix repeat-containing protein [Halocatena pleomorpha]|nr:right-handed parallel beta-helix repeat-containing protein [Halocatena pleomorpha]